MTKLEKSVPTISTKLIIYDRNAISDKTVVGISPENSYVGELLEFW